MRVVEEQIKTPAGAWQAWIEFYKPMAEHGFPVFQASNIAKIEQIIAERQLLRRILWIVAGVAAAVALAAVFWRERKTVRAGDR